LPQDNSPSNFGPASILSVNATDNLTRLSSTQRYKDAAQALQAVKALQLFFKSYLAVERVARVWKTVGELQTTLREKVMGEHEA